MGKGDKRSFKGKLFMGSFGKNRKRKKILQNNKTIIYLITCSTKDSNKLLQEFHNKPLSFDNELKVYRDTLISVIKNIKSHKRKDEKDEIKNTLDFTKNYKAHEFYNGSFYEAARAKNWTDKQTSKVYIMSALYGIIRSDDYIIDYDLMMTDTLSSNVYNKGKEFTPQEFWKGKLEKILEKIKIDNNAIIYNLLADKDYCAVIKNKNLFINPIKQPCKGDKKKCKKKTRKWFVRHINENKENDNGNSNETNNLNMKKKKARIFYNSNNWIKADNTDFYAKNNDGYGESVGNDIAFGFEEWLFNPILLKLKIGFLECYRHKLFNDTVDIILYTRDRSRGWLSVAELKGVIQIKDNEIKHFKTELEKNNWQQQCYNDLENICHSDADEIEIKNRWDNHWNSIRIVQPRNHPIDLPKIGFLVNIKYEDIIYHNLNEFDPNDCWRLTKRYNLEDNILWEEEKNSNTPKTTGSLNSPPNHNEHNNNSFPNEPHQCYEQNYIILLIETVMNNPQRAREHLINANTNFGKYIRTEIRNNKTVLIICAGAVHNLYNNGYRGNVNSFRYSNNYRVGPGLPACVGAMANYTINKPNISFFNHGNNSSQTRFEIT